MEYPGFCGSFSEAQALTADNETLINMYVERIESPGATSRTQLYPTPGVEEIVEAASGPGRAHFYENGREFAVISTTFWEIDQAGVMTSRGTVAIGSNPATISSNGDGGGQLFITSGDNGYIFDLATNVLTQVAALNGKATMGGQLDGYFLALDAATSTLYISDLLDGLTWDPTQFAQRSIAPDPWVAMKINGRNVWLFGEQTSEVWFNAGTSPFPFAPHPSGYVPWGIAAPFSAAVADGALFWLGASSTGNGFILKASGFTPEVISTFPLQKVINDYTTVSDAVADVYNDAGHTFYLLHFPSAGITWAFDLQTSLWAKRGTWISENSVYTALRTRFPAFAFGEHRWLDSSTGAIYRVDRAFALDVDDRPIRRVRRCPTITVENQLVQYPGFELDMEPGQGTATGQGADPQVMLRLSNDGGKNWGAEMWRTAGKIGEYGRRARWNRLGHARRRVFEVAFSDPAPFRITNAYLNPDPVPSGRPRRQR